MTLLGNSSPRLPPPPPPPHTHTHIISYPIQIISAKHNGRGHHCTISNRYFIILYLAGSNYLLSFKAPES